MLRLVLACLLLPAAALAAPQTSCPPLGALPGYIPDDARVRAYDELEFRRRGAGGDTEAVQLAGRACRVTYAIAAGKDPMADFEIQANYRQQIEGMGATIVAGDDNNLYATLTKSGMETWFHVYSQGTSYELRVLQAGRPKLTILPPGPSDHRVLGRMPDFTANKPVVRSFDKMSFTVADGTDTKTIDAQGKTTTIIYEVKPGAPVPSDPEIAFNIQDSLRARGAEILYANTQTVTARLLDNGQVIWVKSYSQEVSIEVSVLEEKPFEPAIKPAQAALATALASTGRVALYVNFDFDRATLRPDATPVVTQVAAMLKADPKLRLAIEGHTDALGTAERNRKLSADRAAAFATALAAQGIAPDRLTSAGFGPDKPVAPNETSDGRARNRRVELVRM